MGNEKKGRTHCLTMDAPGTIPLPYTPCAGFFFTLCEPPFRAASQKVSLAKPLHQPENSELGPYAHR